MKQFSRVCQRLESVPFHRSKPALLAEYLKTASARDASWALYLLLGGQLPRLLPPEALRDWILSRSGFPAWLFDECREHAGDLSETVVLLGELVSRPADASPVSAPSPPDELGLGPWIVERLFPLGQLKEAERQACVLQWWQEQCVDVSWAAHALASGKFPVHVPRRVAEDAVREAWGDAAVPLLDSRLAEIAAEVLALDDSALRAPGPAQLNLFASTPAKE